MKSYFCRLLWCLTTANAHWFCSEAGSLRVGREAPHILPDAIRTAVTLHMQAAEIQTPLRKSYLSQLLWSQIYSLACLSPESPCSLGLAHGSVCKQAENVNFYPEAISTQLSVLLKLSSAEVALPLHQVSPTRLPHTQG